MTIQRLLSLASALVAALAVSGCGQADEAPAPAETPAEPPAAAEPAADQLVDGARQRLGIYAEFPLTADLSHLSDKQKEHVSYRFFLHLLF